MIVEPYLSFEGRCEEAIEFYKKAIGAEVQFMMRFKENPEPPPPGTEPAGMENKILHATVKIGDSVVMASDGQCTGKAVFSGINLTITTENDAEAKRVYNALSDGGQVQMPLTKTFFSSSFGMLADRFGVGWMVLVKSKD